MLEELIDTADWGGFYTLQVKQKARANRLVRTEYCSRGYHIARLIIRASM